MDREDTLAVMAVLKAAYPGYYRGMSRRDADSVVALWQDEFASDDPVIVAAAVKALIDGDEKGFPPHIGAVKAYLRRITQPGGLNELEAWGLVWRAVQNSSYHAQREFAKLPQEVQRAVGAPEVLKAWAQLPPDTVQSVTASNFQRAFRARQRSEREYAALPPDVKALAAKLSGGLALEGEA